MSQDSSYAAAPAPSGFGAWLHVWGPTLWAAAMVLAATYFLYLTSEIAYAARPGRLGPVFWPRVILVLMVLTAGWDCVVEARRARGRALSLVTNGAAEAVQPRVWWLMALGLVITLAYVNLATVIGFPVANLLFMFVFMMIAGFRRPVAALVISTVGTLVLVVLFIKIVYVSLPIGVGPFQSITLLLYSLLGIT